MPPGKTSKLPSSMAFRVETFSLVFLDISSNEIPLVFRIDPTVQPSIGKVAILPLPTRVLSALENSHYRSFSFVFVFFLTVPPEMCVGRTPVPGIHDLIRNTSTFSCFISPAGTASIRSIRVFPFIERNKSRYVPIESPPGRLLFRRLGWRDQPKLRRSRR